MLQKETQLGPLGVYEGLHFRFEFVGGDFKRSQK